MYKLFYNVVIVQILRCRFVILDIYLRHCYSQHYVIKFKVENVFGGYPVHLFGEI